MEFKYKVGDKVKIKSGDGIYQYAGGWIGPMNKYVGDVTTVEKQLERCKGPAYEVYGIPFTFDERGLELVISHEPNVTATASYRASRCDMPEIKNVIFNKPLTIIVWADGTKTFVKCGEGDTYDYEKGMAMAIAKKAYGNKYKSTNIIDEWVERRREK